jgi:heat shock protein HslJ
MNRCLLALVATVAGAACDNDNSTVAPSDIIGNSWRLVSMWEPGGAAIVVDDPSRYTLEFSTEGRLLVRSDCNSCGGSYSLTDSSLEVGPLVCTRAFCGEASLDGRYTIALERARSVAADDDAMMIQGGGGILRFRR